MSHMKAEVLQGPHKAQGVLGTAGQNMAEVMGLIGAIYRSAIDAQDVKLACVSSMLLVA